MRVPPHAKALRRAKLSHGGLERAHAVCVVFQKNYCLAIHGLFASTVSVFVVRREPNGCAVWIIDEIVATCARIRKSCCGHSRLAISALRDFSGTGYITCQVLFF